MKIKTVILGLFFLIIPRCKTQVATSSPAVKSDSKQHSLGHFKVTVTFSKAAIMTLRESKETIIVEAMFSGLPKKGAKGHYFADNLPDNLGDSAVEIQPGGIAEFGDVKLLQDKRNRLNEENPRFLINVFSGGKSSKNNLLACDVYEGFLKEAEGKNIPIFCKLIRE